MGDQLSHYENILAYETNSWDLMAAMEGGENVIAVDSRSPEAYAAGRIPGAINIPHREMSHETASTPGRETLNVTYSYDIGATPRQRERST
jgi:rhodanese-related sulfurtransferase